jgi:ABC-type multidrug transport system ATPase subunit
MLSISGLTKTYANGVRALNNVSLDIGVGMFGLLGPNGAGKSSLMRTIATLQDPDSGTIRFDGLDVVADKLGLRRQLGYLPQDFGVYPKVSALELLDHFAILKGLTQRAERKECVEALLRQTNLWEARKRAVASFSGGMRQRFGIAQALLGAPRLVIVDEPTAGLDPEERNRFLDLLASIGDQVVIILSTHIVEDVADLCPRMAMICRGEVVMQGAPQEAIRELRGAVWRRPLGAEALGDFEQRHTVLKSRRSAGERLVSVFSREMPDAGFHSAEPDLEDVYFLRLRGGNHGL